MSDSTQIGRIFRDRRESLRMTQRQVAELCDISIRGLEQIELGDSDPKWSTVTRIVDVLEMDLGDFNSCVHKSANKLVRV